MDYNLNKLSINENIPNGFIWVNRYSSTNDSDKMGRWARNLYFNSLRIANVGGYDKISSHLNRKQLTPESFHAHLYFPCSSNQGGDFKMVDSFDEAKKYCEEMFIDFKKHIK